MNVVCACKGTSPAHHGRGQTPGTHSSTDELLLHIERDCAACNFLQTNQKNSISAQAEFRMALGDPPS